MKVKKSSKSDSFTFSQSESAMILCNFCTGNAKVATVACENCTYYYCSTCVKKFHPKVGPLKNHNLLKASALRNEETFCIDHGDKYCVFCEQCKQLLCLNCVSQHASHDLLNMQQAFAKSKEVLYGLSDRLDKHLIAATKIKQETEAQISALKKDSKIAQKKIRLECDFLRSTISGCEKNMIHIINEEVREKVYRLQHALDEIPKLSTGSMLVLNDMSGVLGKSSATHFLSRFGELNSRAESQLKILDSLNRTTDTYLLFDHKTFDCSHEVNMLADKLCVPATDPHALPYACESLSQEDLEQSNSDADVTFAKGDGGTNVIPNKKIETKDSQHVQSGNAALDRSSTRAETCTNENLSKDENTNSIFVRRDNSSTIITESQSAPERDTSGGNSFSSMQEQTRRPWLDTFVNKAICKHPELLHHSISLDAFLHADGKQPSHQQVEDESNLDPSIYHSFSAVDTTADSNNNAKSHKPFSVIMAKANSGEYDIGRLLEESIASGTFKLLASESVPPTTAGVTQRSRDGYYAGYTLSSERQSVASVTEGTLYNTSDPQVPLLDDCKAADQQLITDINGDHATPGLAVN